MKELLKTTVAFEFNHCKQKYKSFLIILLDFFYIRGFHLLNKYIFDIGMTWSEAKRVAERDAEHNGRPLTHLGVIGF